MLRESGWSHGVLSSLGRDCVEVGRNLNTLSSQGMRLEQAAGAKHPGRSSLVLGCYGVMVAIVCRQDEASIGVDTAVGL